MKAPWLRLAVFATSCGLAAAACSQNGGAAQAVEQDARPRAQAAAPARSGALPDFAALVERNGPAVVNVSVVGRAQPTADFPGGVSPDDPFYEFFRRFGRPMPRGGEAPVPRGEGSGFIVTADGYVLTNAHVVEDASEVTVRTTDRREYTAKVVGADKATDVAVLKIDGKNLPTVKLGDPSKLRPGEWVIAIGSPFGFENSVTAAP